MALTFNHKNFNVCIKCVNRYFTMYYLLSFKSKILSIAKKHDVDCSKSPQRLKKCPSAFPLHQFLLFDN